MKRPLLLCALLFAPLASASTDGAGGTSPRVREVRERADLKQDTFLYRIPALGGGPVEGLDKPLPKKTSVTVTVRSSDDRWAFVETGALRGWVEMEFLESFQSLPPPEKVAAPAPVAVAPATPASYYRGLVFPKGSRPYVLPESQLLDLLEKKDPERERNKP
jgi:hypothetical protein